jgi:hypothetical protein
MQYFNDCINAPTEEASEAAREKLKVRANRDCGEAPVPKQVDDEADADRMFEGNNNDSTAWLKVVGYLDRHWGPYKELCIKFSTNKIRHLGYNTTSPSEEGHDTLKAWLQTANHDLLGLIERMQPYYQGHVDRYRTRLGSHQDIAMVQYRNDPVYSRLVRVLSHRALDELHKQQLLAKEYLQKQQENITFEIPRCIHRF